MPDVTRVVITGAGGLIGWHAHVRLHAANCAAGFKGMALPYDIVALDHAGFDDNATLRNAVSGAQVILHFAGVNRGSDDVVEAANPAIATRLAEAIAAVAGKPHVVYANSVHSNRDTPYGRSKRRAAEILSATAGGLTDLVLPHIFGEGARPFYNNVTATLIARIVAGEVPEVDPQGRVALLHAGAAAQLAIDLGCAGHRGQVAPEGRAIAVTALYEKLLGYHDGYVLNLFPDLSDPFDRDLFNSYRAATYPAGWPRDLTLNTDARGTLFEAVKGGGGGQCFLSTTHPGVTRGNHFHLGKVERFLVLQGEAIIRIRRVLGDQVWEYKVSGDMPAPVDMPTLHTHSIENVGSCPLLTLFWTHDLFDPANPDTFADRVLG